MQGQEAGLSASEVAEKIKTLKSTRSIEATPQRVGQKQSTAEEPVTTRIRRRAEEHPDAAVRPDLSCQSASEPSVAPSTAAKTLSPESATNYSQMPFQQRIEIERQPKDQEPTLN